MKSLYTEIQFKVDSDEVAPTDTIRTEWVSQSSVKFRKMFGRRHFESVFVLAKKKIDPRAYIS